MHCHLWRKWLRQNPEYQLPDPLSDCTQSEGLCQRGGEDHTGSRSSTGGKMPTYVIARLGTCVCIGLVQQPITDNQLSFFPQKQSSIPFFCTLLGVKCIALLSASTMTMLPLSERPCLDAIYTFPEYVV